MAAKKGKKKRGGKKTKTTKKAAKTAKPAKRKAAKKPAKRAAARKPAKKAAPRSAAKTPAAAHKAAPKAAPPAGVPSMLGGAPTSSHGLDDEGGKFLHLARSPSGATGLSVPSLRVRVCSGMLVPSGDALRGRLRGGGQLPAVTPAAAIVPRSRLPTGLTLPPRGAKKRQRG